MTQRIISDDIWGQLCIYAEARSESFEGQCAVGEVIRNRTVEKYFSQGTVVSTVTWPYQFSWLNTNDRQRCFVLGACEDDPAWETAKRAWAASATTNHVGDAVLYHADYVDPWWSKANRTEFVVRIGRHLFYRRKAS